MIKVGVADYGIFAWEGGFFDYLERMKKVGSVGYDGLERLHAQTADQAMTLSAHVRKMGMDFATCLAPTPELSLQWTAALGRKYMWTNVIAKDFDTFCRQVNSQISYAKPYGVEVALHNHLGSLVETQDQLLRFLETCPECRLVLDTGHLTVAEGGDPLYIVQNYFDRIAAIHLKEWVSTDPGAENWYDRGYFCELGGGNIPFQNDEIVKELVGRGYDGWIFVEHDSHKQEPLIDLKASREYLKKLGV